AGQQRAPGRGLFKSWQPHVELRPVGEIGAAANEDHVAAGALEVDMAARVLASDPLRFAGRQRDLAVDRQRQLERDAWPASGAASEPAAYRLSGGFAADAERYLDAGTAQATNTLPRRPFIGILEGNDDALGLGREQEIGAGGTALAGMRAG